MRSLDRLERVTDLLLVLLETARPLSLREIADRVPGYPDTHGARRQAFERDKRLLRDEGIPVLVEPVGGQDQLGYRVDPDAYYLPDLGLSAEEQAALNLAVAGVHLGEPTGQDALEKLGVAVDGPGRNGVVPHVDLALADGLAALPRLFDAVRSKATATFDYRGATRQVDVAAVRFRRGHWYAVGHDRDRGEARTFRVDRIERAPELGPAGSAVLPEGFDAGSVLGRDPWQFGAGEELEVEVLVDPAEAGRVVAEVGEETVIERRDDGAVLVRLAVTDPEALVTWALDLLDHAEIVGPASVRARMVERLHAQVAAAGASGR
jgi:predicted DNA-binding transcriptional regulator YafY